MEWVKLTDICNINDKSVQEFEGLREYVATGDIDFNNIIASETITYNNKPSRANRKVDIGDVIFAKMKGTVKVFKITEEISDKYIFSTGFTTLNAKLNKLTQEYLYYILISDIFQSQKDKYSSGATQKAINNTNLKKIKIPLPSLDIQEQIVELLDKAQELIDKRKAQIHAMDSLIESIFYAMFGDPVRNGKGWEVKDLKDITDKIGSGATPKGGESAYKESGISLIRSMNVYDNRFEYKGLAFIDESQAEKLKNVKIYEDDILINITGASITRCCIVPNVVLPAKVNQHVSILRCNENINRIYLLHLIISKKFKQKIYNISISGGATREALTKANLENLEIPIPLQDLQNEFAQKVELIEREKEVLEESLELLEENYRSIMDRAFKGELFN